MNRPNLLILDEPTNHMDIVGKEALEHMLASFSGTVLFVSHDRYFIRQIATGILEFEGDQVVQYPCSYEDYLLEKNKRSAAAGKGGNTAPQSSFGKGSSDAGKSAGASGLPSGKASSRQAPTLANVFDGKTYYNPGKIKSRLQKQLEKYEAQLSASEQHADELKLQLMAPSLGTDYEKLMELQTQLDKEEHTQETLLERMMETEKELEELESFQS